MKNIKEKSSLALFALPIILSLFLLYFSINNFKFGIDISDESFYLSLISNPSLYKTTISQFGFVYNPLFLILNGNIFLLRTVNFLIIFFLSWILSYQFLLLVFRNYKKNKLKIYLLLFSNGFASSGLACLFLLKWIPTPSYNYLNFIGVLIFSIGIILILQKEVNKNEIIS
mgnify:CR=1 FL=1